MTQHQNDIKRLSIRLPGALHTEFRIACLREGVDMSELIIKCVQKYVNTVNKKLENNQ